MLFKGNVWKFGDNIDTDAIIPARYLNTSDPVELAKHCMEDADPAFVTKMKPGDIIVGGKNVYPQDLERLAAETPGVHPGRLVAFGVFNEEAGTECAVLAASGEGKNVQRMSALALQVTDDIVARNGRYRGVDGRKLGRIQRLVPIRKRGIRRCD